MNIDSALRMIDNEISNFGAKLKCKLAWCCQPLWEVTAGGREGERGGGREREKGRGGRRDYKLVAKETSVYSDDDGDDVLRMMIVILMAVVSPSILSDNNRYHSLWSRFNKSHNNEVHLTLLSKITVSYHSCTTTHHAQAYTCCGQVKVKSFSTKHFSFVIIICFISYHNLNLKSVNWPDPWLSVFRRRE